MGAIAEAMMAYMQPLFDQTDGSADQLEKAMAIGTFCYNLSLLPDDSREEMISDMKLRLDVDDDEYDDFRRLIVDPMIHRHHEMFPRMHERRSTVSSHGGSLATVSPSHAGRERVTTGEVLPPMDRYAPCFCNSGKKYKFCCGKKRR